MDVNRIILMIILMMLATNYLYHETTCSVFTWSLSVILQFLITLLIIIASYGHIRKCKDKDVVYGQATFNIFALIIGTIGVLSFFMQVRYCSITVMVITVVLQCIVNKWYYFMWRGIIFEIPGDIIKSFESEIDPHQS